LEIRGVHDDDYEYAKYILWCYCPRGGDFEIHEFDMLHRLE